MLQVTTTSDQIETLNRIAIHLIENRLSACCQTEGPITSTYRWDGKTESTQEYRLTIKTVSDRYQEIEQAILNLHHYDQPQIIGITISQVEAGYKNWVAESTK